MLESIIGFFPDTTPVSVRVRITTNGQVTGERTYADGRQVRIDLGSLSHEAVIAATAFGRTLEASELVDGAPGEPVCADAPITTVYVYNGRKPIPLQESKDCHLWRRSDNAGDILISLLNSFNQLQGSIETIVPPQEANE